MIVLDLEWNQPFGGRRMEEIIQIGAVRLAEPGGAVQDWFNMHIRPSIWTSRRRIRRFWIGAETTPCGRNGARRITACWRPTPPIGGCRSRR